VLSWDTVLHDAADIHDGQNLVFHEFAHQLDNESGAAEGAPTLPRRSMYVAWARVLGREYRSLIESVERHRPTVLDKYGATNPAEFFAVATKCFFEKPIELEARNPELYDQLRSFYVRDPASRSQGAGRPASSPRALTRAGAAGTGPRSGSIRYGTADRNYRDRFRRHPPGVECAGPGHPIDAGGCRSPRLRVLGEDSGQTCDSVGRAGYSARHRQVGHDSRSMTERGRVRRDRPVGPKQEPNQGQ